MEYQVLARKWRPRNFDQVIGQDHIIKSLKNSLLKNTIAHAYLLTGTRGVGKTTIARIFSKSLMCPNRSSQGDPCLECSTCKSIDNTSSIDYLEIDGASNNGVENVRQIIDNVQYLPTSGEYKVYVIDEVHMLSNSAFNALLKTLEEPPKHAIFIFATTDPHKLLGTVLSRCQRFDFKSVDVDTLSAHITKISTAENISFENQNLITQLAKFGNGSVRDTLSLLDQVLNYADNNKIDENALTQSLGIVKFSIINDLISDLLEGNISKVNKTFAYIMDLNVDLEIFSKQLLDELFNIIQNVDNPEYIKSNTSLSDELVAGLTISELFWIFETYTKDITWALSTIAPDKVIQVILQKITLRRDILKPGADTLSKKKTEIEEVEVEAEVDQHLEPEDLIPKPIKEKVDPQWEGLLKGLGAKNQALMANLEHGNLLEYVFREEELHITIGFKRNADVFLEFINEPEHKTQLLDYISELEKVNVDEIRFETVIVGKEEAQDINFKSKVEIMVQNDLNEEDYLKEKMLSNKYVVEAQKVFSSKVDKVVIDKKETR
jgi:DNA polymerase-3 subunit gamma/tau